MPVCLARSIGLKIVKSVRLRAEVVFSQNMRFAEDIRLQKRLFKLLIFAKEAMVSRMCIYMYTS